MNLLKLVKLLNLVILTKLVNILQGGTVADVEGPRGAAVVTESQPIHTTLICVIGDNNEICDTSKTREYSGTCTTSQPS